MINNNGSAEFLISTNHSFTVSPEFIGSRLLLKMRRMAERQLGVLIEKAVISVPAEFDERQRNYTVRAANLAGQYCDYFDSKLKVPVGHLTQKHTRQFQKFNTFGYISAKMFNSFSYPKASNSKKCTHCICGLAQPLLRGLPFKKCFC